MARQHVTIISDDLGDEAAALPTVFTYDGQRYEIDLSEANAERLRTVQSSYVEDMQPFLNKARAVARTRSIEVTAARIWAREKGLTVPSRGPLPARMIADYQTYLDEGGQAPEVPTTSRDPRIPDARRVRVWAAEHGIAVAARGPLPRWLIDRFEEASSESHLSRTEASQLLAQVRSWATEHGHTVAARGPVSTSLIEQYHAHLAQSRGHEAALVREWAAANDIAVAPRGPVSASIVARYHQAMKDRVSS